MPTTSSTPPPGFFRRLGAMIYDALLLFAVLIMLSYPYVWLTGGDKPSFWIRAAYQTYLLVICFLFYAGPWVHGGQTLGMRTWRIKLVREDGGPVSWTIAFKRFIHALVSLFFLGLGFLWILHDRDKRAWHDRLSATRMILLPKTPKI